MSGPAGERPQEARRGALLVFEGPDGVGKTTLVERVRRRVAEFAAQDLAARGLAIGPVSSLAFPGREPGTLGRHVYALHHDPGGFGVAAMSPISLQLLHVAAHLDAVDTQIRPRVARGEVVLLDRYWWSTWVYGVTGGADRETLAAMLDLERRHWGALRPDAVYLVRRGASLRPEESRADFERRSAEYARLAADEADAAPVVVIENETTIEAAADAVVRDIVVRLAPTLPA